MRIAAQFVNVMATLGLMAIPACLTFMASAQPLRVGTEFVRYTPSGSAFPQDATPAPMEILSPPLVRGVWNSFRLLVDLEQPNDSFRLYIAQNPENAMQVRLFREVPAEGLGGWRIARREAVPLPFSSSAIPEKERGAGRTNYSFWLDVRPPANYPSRRLKLEAQILMNGHWFIYPIEIRVLEFDLPSLPPGQNDIPEASIGIASADTLHREVVKRFVCGAPAQRKAVQPVPAGPKGSAEALAARAFDFTMDALATRSGRDAVIATLRETIGFAAREAWCRQPTFPLEAHGVEWPAVLRNRLLRNVGDPD